jgi:hypothetical protein
MERNKWSVHFNSSRDGSVFAGDGGDSDMVAHAPDGKWLYRFTPHLESDEGQLSGDYVHWKLHLGTTGQHEG